eukprot:TRINITY_DN2878_c0_g1_i1.p1 TRINITY_DN2878_c0_g1~~TRINITY_DN2878_c0_g1_i1.p1  ORF type:complete len:782 (-),score=231.19 TRINITY_DN2878_c0_g1_i1:54-2399(-)
MKGGKAKPKMKPGGSKGTHKEIKAMNTELAATAVAGGEVEGQQSEEPEREIPKLDLRAEKIIIEMNKFDPADYEMTLFLSFKSKESQIFYDYMTLYHTLSNMSVGLGLSAIGSILALAFNSSNASIRGLNSVCAGLFLIFAVICFVLHKKHARSMAQFESASTPDSERVKALRRTVADVQVISVVRSLASLLWIGWTFANMYLALEVTGASCNSAAGSWSAAVFVLPIALKLLGKYSFMEFTFITIINIGIVAAFEKIATLWCLQSPFSGIYMFLWTVPVVYMVEKNEREIFVLAKSRNAALANEVYQRPVVTVPQAGVSNSSYGLRLLYHVFKRLQVPIDSVSAGVDVAKTKEDEMLGRKPDPSGSWPDDSLFTPVKRNLMYINQVVHNVLSMADLDSGNYHLKFSKFDLRNLLENMAASYADYVSEKDASLVVKIANDLPHFFVGDESRVKEVLINLLSNAFRYSEKGGQVKLTASLVQDYEIGESIDIKISDSGIGMTNDARFLLFDPEGQLQVASANPNSGIGVGLLLCRKIIELHGGVIGVDALEGVGSSFFIRLPTNLKETEAEEKEEEFVVVVQRQAETSVAHPDLDEKDADAGAAGHGERRRILLVDDSAAARAQMGRFILSWEWECQEFKSGKDALEAIEIIRKDHGPTSNDFRYAFDVLMIDTDMKGVSGIQMIQRVRELGIKSPILALIDQGREADFKDVAMKSGANDCIEKPMLKQKLREKLEKLLLLMVRDESSYEGSRSEKLTFVHSQIKPQAKKAVGRHASDDDDE